MEGDSRGMQCLSPGRVEISHAGLGELIMMINERRHLREAMQQLTFGDSRKFCDLLWLGFGDGWRPMLADMISRQLVRASMKDGVEEFEITPRGRSWTQQVGTMAAAAA